jgi:hypothetical protein
LPDILGDPNIVLATSPRGAPLLCRQRAPRRPGSAKSSAPWRLALSSGAIAASPRRVHRPHGAASPSFEARLCPTARNRDKIERSNLIFLSCKPFAEPSAATSAVGTKPLRDVGRECPLCPALPTSTCSAIAMVSSTSMPRYLTVLSIFVWPSKSCTAPQVADTSINQCRLCPPQRMGAEQLGIRPDAGDPSEDKPCILARGHARADPAAAREQKLVRLLSCSSQVVIDALTGLVRQLELDRPALSSFAGPSPSSRTLRISLGVGITSPDLTSEDLFSSPMISMQSSTHSSQINTVGPAMSLRSQFRVANRECRLELA